MRTLRGVCEDAMARAEGKPCPPVITLPVEMVLGLISASERRAS
jgi:hypothetical protein